jgi:hypothetical protein
MYVWAIPLWLERIIRIINCALLRVMAEISLEGSTVIPRCRGRIYLFI